MGESSSSKGSFGRVKVKHVMFMKKICSIFGLCSGKARGCER